MSEELIVPKYYGFSVLEIFYLQPSQDSSRISSYILLHVHCSRHFKFGYKLIIFSPFNINKGDTPHSFFFVFLFGIIQGLLYEQCSQESLCAWNPASFTDTTFVLYSLLKPSM